MLTDTKVRTAKSRAKPYKLADANRLFLLVASGGGKLWRWNYNFDGKWETRGRLQKARLQIRRPPTCSV